MRKLFQLTYIFIFTSCMALFPLKKSEAAMISTRDFVSIEERKIQEQKVIKFMERDAVKDQLVKLGVSAEEAKLRVAQLSPQELQDLSHQIDMQMAAGDFGVIGILTVVLLVLLIIFVAKRV